MAFGKLLLLLLIVVAGTSGESVRHQGHEDHRRG